MAYGKYEKNITTNFCQQTKKNDIEMNYTIKKKKIVNEIFEENKTEHK